MVPAKVMWCDMSQSQHKKIFVKVENFYSAAEDGEKF